MNENSEQKRKVDFRLARRFADKHPGMDNPATANQKSSVISPHSATPTSSIDHSEGLSANSLPSLITWGIIARTRS
jgi:hypothetical protein